MNLFNNYFENIKEKKVSVIGVGVSNLPLIRLLAESGAIVTAFDKNENLEHKNELSALGVKLCLGENYLEKLDGEIIFRTPGLHPSNPYLEKARQNGAEITSEIELFLKLCPAKIFAITGSDGKTTSTTLTNEILKKAGYTCYLGGNIGNPLLNLTDKMKKSDMVVLELSSFQLITMKNSASVAAITNVTPNHLDIHKDMNEYINAKTNVFNYQQAGDRLVLNADDKVSESFKPNNGVELLKFSLEKPVLNGAFLENESIFFSKNGKKEFIMNINEIKLPGKHNIANLLTAICNTYGYVKTEDICFVAKNFGGVAHRIELVREIDGVKFYNDSIASSPSRTIAGLRSFKQKIILIAGGYDKKIPYDVIGDDIVKSVKKLVLIGATAQKIKQSVINSKEYSNCNIEIYEEQGFKEAILKAKQLSEKGDIIILSPASASFDMFKNFEDRGNQFKEIVNSL